MGNGKAFNEFNPKNARKIAVLVTLVIDFLILKNPRLKLSNLLTLSPRKRLFFVSC
jgi:hypothetical protein